MLTLNNQSLRSQHNSTYYYIMSNNSNRSYTPLFRGNGGPKDGKIPFVKTNKKVGRKEKGSAKYEDAGELVAGESCNEVDKNNQAFLEGDPITKDENDEAFSSPISKTQRGGVLSGKKMREIQKARKERRELKIEKRGDATPDNIIGGGEALKPVTSGTTSSPASSNDEVKSHPFEIKVRELKTQLNALKKPSFLGGKKSKKGKEMRKKKSSKKSEMKNRQKQSEKYIITYDDNHIVTAWCKLCDTVVLFFRMVEGLGFIEFVGEELEGVAVGEASFSSEDEIENGLSNAMISEEILPPTPEQQNDLLSTAPPIQPTQTRITTLPISIQTSSFTLISILFQSGPLKSSKIFPLSNTRKKILRLEKGKKKNNGNGDNSCNAKGSEIDQRNLALVNTAGKITTKCKETIAILLRLGSFWSERQERSIISWDKEVEKILRKEERGDDYIKNTKDEKELEGGRSGETESESSSSDYGDNDDEEEEKEKEQEENEDS